MDTLEKTRLFRSRQGREKMEISKKLFEKGDYANATIQAYLSIFYSVRTLLLDDNIDSDDFDKIASLSDRYYSPTGWTSCDIPSLLREGHAMHDRSDQSHAGRDDAKRFVESAEKLYGEIVSPRPKEK